jgi:hypothetical protein
VETLIKGDVPSATLTESRVRIEKGSLKAAVLVGHLLAADVRADLTKLTETGDLDAIQPKRAQVIERWQTRANRSPSRVYSIALDKRHRPMQISSTSQLQHAGENAWVSVEKHLTGKVVDLGGKQSPNVHLVLADSGEVVKIDATEEQLGSEKEN